MVSSLSNSSYKTKNSSEIYINSLPSDKFLDTPKFKAFGDDKININQTQKLFLGWIENMGKGENAFSPFPTKLFLGLLNVVIVW